MEKIPTTGTVSSDDPRLSYFTDTLKARGIEMQPEILQAFAEKKDRGETEAQIIEHANQWTDTVTSRDKALHVIEGAVFGTAGASVGSWLKEGRPSWSEALKKNPKTMAFGIVAGAGAGWAVDKLISQAGNGDLEARWTDFKQKTHEMEMAWTEALAKQKAEKESSSLPQQNTTAR